MLHKCSTYIASFLLAVFAWILVPSSVLHDSFAGHHDTECTANHFSDELSFEQVHTHCDVFATHSLVYEKANGLTALRLICTCIAEFKSRESGCLYQRSFDTILLRGPPAC